MKRTERHHLKEDEMVHGLNWFVHFYKTWQREILIAAATLVFAFAVFGVLVLVRTRGENVQSRLAGEIVSLAADLDTKPENLASLEKLAGPGKYARFASLELARHWVEKGDWAKAEAALSRIPATRKDILYYQAEDLKAQVLVRRKEYDKAIAIYRKIREEDPKSYPPDAVLFQLAEALELKGEKKEALDIFKKLQGEYAQTYFGYEASMRASRLELQK